jgi:hypothetical protein
MAALSNVISELREQPNSETRQIAVCQTSRLLLFEAKLALRYNRGLVTPELAAEIEGLFADAVEALSAPEALSVANNAYRQRNVAARQDEFRQAVCEAENRERQEADTVSSLHQPPTEPTE